MQSLWLMAWRDYDLDVLNNCATMVGNIFMAFFRVILFQQVSLSRATSNHYIFIDYETEEKKTQLEIQKEAKTKYIRDHKCLTNGVGRRVQNGKIFVFNDRYQLSTALNEFFSHNYFRAIN